jgi:hypothetical protein
VRSKTAIASVGAFCIVIGIALAALKTRQNLKLSALKPDAVLKKIDTNFSTERLQIYPSPVSDRASIDSKLQELASLFLGREHPDWHEHLRSSQTKLGAVPVVFTRSQFKDVVLNKMPGSLPTDSMNDAVLGIDLSNDLIDLTTLKETLHETRLVWENLCSPSQIQANPSWKRISLILSYNTQSLKCAIDRIKDWQSSNELKLVREVSIVFFDESQGPFFGFITEKKLAFHIQTWKPQWVEMATAKWDDESKLSNQQVRAKRLVQLARPLVYLSDIMLRYEGKDYTTFGHLMIHSQGSAPKGVWAETSQNSRHKQIKPLFLPLEQNKRVFVIGLQGKSFSLQN